MFEKVQNIISEKLNISKEDISLESSFREDFKADSLDLVELVMAMESEFDVMFDDSDFDKIDTVNDVVEYINKLK
jgi:acyl carrier protein